MILAQVQGPLLRVETMTAWCGRKKTTEQQDLTQTLKNPVSENPVSHPLTMCFPTFLLAFNGQEAESMILIKWYRKAGETPGSHPFNYSVHVQIFPSLMPSFHFIRKQHLIATLTAVDGLWSSQAGRAWVPHSESASIWNCQADHHLDSHLKVKS